MLKKQIEVGGIYAAKISGTVVPVRITGASSLGGWNATNVKTGRAVRIKSAAKLRFPVEFYDDGRGPGRWRRAS